MSISKAKPFVFVRCKMPNKFYRLAWRDAREELLMHENAKRQCGRFELQAETLSQQCNIQSSTIELDAGYNNKPKSHKSKQFSTGDLESSKAKSGGKE